MRDDFSLELSAPHLLVIDDDDRLADLLQRYLQREGYIVSVGRNAKEARELLEFIDVDAVILDVRMPGEDGIRLTESLRSVGKEIPILLLSAEGEVESRVRGLQMGADDYLVKPFDAEELKARVNALLRRAPVQRKVRNRRLVLGDLQYDMVQQTLTGTDGLIGLSGKEQAILGVLAQHPHQVLSRDVLHEACGSERQERNIDTLMVRLRKKIEPTPAQPRYLQTIHGRGYVLRPDRITD